ncbi:hypothetical protein [Nocardioides sp. TF02-7]|uniref:hypothetical protein n=1 Tax=Nocardioides sp. TF02-7 TaxID=2917724 RepID=UPI001F057B6A|nr:hypothetical protein [Nocardioides sp. TF02-7]UMG93998.1 hypothetical protein MF408_07925 [Nocardioides sp. TF02-7]
MFVHHCTQCHKRQLIFPSLITAVAPGADDVPVATFTCWCGAEQTAPYGLAPAAAESAGHTLAA